MINASSYRLTSNGRELHHDEEMIFGGIWRKVSQKFIRRIIPLLLSSACIKQFPTEEPSVCGIAVSLGSKVKGRVQ
jgi:hypothetical protein